MTASAEIPARPLFVLSQRGPIAFDIDEEGALQSGPAAGGLATALAAISRQQPVRWVAAALTEGDRLAAEQLDAVRSGATELYLVDLPPLVHQLHYFRFTNPVLWFVQHGLADRLAARHSSTSIAESWRDGYRPANAALAGRLVALARREREPIILTQDYHLYLAPGLLRRALPDALLAHFVHIPWPEPAAWSALPVHIVRGILRGLASANIVGFQTAADADRFLATWAAYGAGPPGSHARPRVGHYPITVDAHYLEALASSPEAEEHHEAVHQLTDLRLIARVDRLDPSKNVPAGFRAFGLLLDQHPSLQKRVRFVAHLVPSRSELPEYQDEQAQAFAAAEAVNRRFGTADWQPIQITFAENRRLALALLQHYDVLLVNSLADGMNLVAKEGAVLNAADGVLVLSRAAGAWEELGEWSLGIDPGDVQGTADALAQALAMPLAERRRRAQGLRQAVQATSLQAWLDHQLADLLAASWAREPHPER